MRKSPPPADLDPQALADLIEEQGVDAVCISVVPPSTAIHARQLSTRLRESFSGLKILVGLWAAEETGEEAEQRLRSSGADDMAGSMAEAVEVLARYSAPVHDKMMPAPIPADEEERLASLGAWNETLDLDRAPAFHRVTEKLARIFDVPMALVSIMEREQQRIRSQVGFKPELLPEQGIPRAESVCGHAIAANEVLVIEDLARDKRFARNPWLLERELRFYAGVPLRTEDGQPVGTICIFDTRPRQLSDRDHRMLRMIAEDLMEELSIQGGIPLAKIA